MSETLWWGTFPAAGMDTQAGVGEGLWRMNPGGEASFAVELPAPNFVATHPDLPLVYAVTGETPSRIACVDVADDAHPTISDLVLTGGSGACHVLVSRDALALYVSNYESGELVVVPLGADGRLATSAPSQVFPGEGSGPVAARQAGPHAHFADYAPDGTTLLACDLGADVLRWFETRADGSLGPSGVAIHLPPGSGPRHFATRGEMVYLACELDHSVKTLRWDPASRTAELVHSTASTTAPLRYGDTVYEGHVAVVSGALLVSVRGCDVIALHDLAPDGIPTYRASFDSGGNYPRHFAVVGEQLVVGNEKSHVVSSFDLAAVLSLDPEDEPGAIAELPHASVPVTSPACIAIG